MPDRIPEGRKNAGRCDGQLHDNPPAERQTRRPRFARDASSQFAGRPERSPYRSAPEGPENSVTVMRRAPPARPGPPPPPSRGSRKSHLLGRQSSFVYPERRQGVPGLIQSSVLGVVWSRSPAGRGRHGFELGPTAHPCRRPRKPKTVNRRTPNGSWNGTTRGFCTLFPARLHGAIGRRDHHFAVVPRPFRKPDACLITACRETDPDPP